MNKTILISLLLSLFFGHLDATETTSASIEKLYFLNAKSGEIEHIPLDPKTKFSEISRSIAHTMRLSSGQDITAFYHGQVLSILFFDESLEEIRSDERFIAIGSSEQQAILVIDKKPLHHNVPHNPDAELVRVLHNYRYDSESLEAKSTPERTIFWQSSYPVYRLSLRAKRLVGNSYIKKYFPKDGSKILHIGESLEDIVEKMTEFIDNPSAKAGFFTIPRFVHKEAADYQEAKEFTHPIPLVLIKNETGLHLFISDSIGSSADAYKQLEKFCKTYDIKVYLSLLSRQSNESSCHSDALYYLERAARLASFFDAMEILDPKNPTDFKKIKALNDKNNVFTKISYSLAGRDLTFFIDSPDLLLTSQAGYYLADIWHEKLEVSKNNQTVGQKLEKYTMTMTYYDKNNPHRTRDFKERTFLGFLNKKHYYLLDTHIKKD